MRKYLAELHKKPDHHKRHFALLASSTITLFIFGFWSLVTFGTNDEIIAENENTPTLSVQRDDEVSPFESLRMSLAASLEALRGNFVELKSGMEAIDFESEYKEMRDGALDVYGQ